MKSVREQADFIVSYIKPGVGNINYSATACYALALVGELTGDAKYKKRAAELAVLVKPHFTKMILYFMVRGYIHMLNQPKDYGQSI